MVALNGPSLKSAMAEGGLIEQALIYYFSRNDRKIGSVPGKFRSQKAYADKLDALVWNIKVPPLPIPLPGSEVADVDEKDADVHEEDLQHCWPEEEETLARLNLVSLREDETRNFEALQDRE